MSRLLLENVAVLEGGQPTLSALAIDAGRIVGLGITPQDFVADQRIDADAAWLLPGLVDLRAYLRQPGFEHKATVNSELKAAVAGGVTAVCCMPQTHPVNDTPAVSRLISDLGQEAEAARLYTVGALTEGLRGEQLSEMHALRMAGCIALSNARQPFANLRTMKRCLEYACSLDIPVMVAAEEPSLAAEGCVHEGPVSSRLGLAGIPGSAETLAVAQWLMLAAESEARLHLAGISSGDSISLIQEARAQGVRVTADVALANLLYTDQAVDGFDAQYHVRPPLRTRDDRQALREAVLSGAIDCIALQHEPHDEAARQAPFAETEAGMSQFDVCLPNLWALAKGDMQQFLAFVHAAGGRAREIFNLPPVALTVGSPADLVLFKPGSNWQADSAHWYSAGRNSPWFGEQLGGCVTAALVGGKLFLSERQAG